MPCHLCFCVVSSGLVCYATPVFAQLYIYICIGRERERDRERERERENYYNNYKRPLRRRALRLANPPSPLWGRRGEPKYFSIYTINEMLINAFDLEFMLNGTSNEYTLQG